MDWTKRRKAQEKQRAAYGLCLCDSCCALDPRRRELRELRKQDLRVQVRKVAKKI